MSQTTLDRPNTAPDAAPGTAVAIYPNHGDAEAAVKSLQKSGFDMRLLSLMGKDYHTEEHVVGYYNVGDRMMAWGKLGAFWGSIWGLLFWSAFFVIPGIGPIIIAGPLVAALVGALEGAVVIGGLSALGAALVSVGIPENSVVQYEAQIAAGKFLLLVHGPHEKVAVAKAILEMTNHQGLDEHVV